MSEQHVTAQPAAPQDVTTDATAGSSPPPQPEEQGGAQQVKQRAQEAAAPAKQKAREVAGDAKGHAHAAAEQAKDQAAAQVDEKSTQVGRQIGSHADALDGVAGELRKQGKEGPAKVAEQAAEKVRNVGEYLERADGESLVGTARQAAQDNPAAAAAVGAAAGFAAGRVVKASLDDSDEERSRTGTDAAVSGDPGRPGTGGP